MQYKALITRMLTMADESISILVNDTDNFEDFKDKVFESFTITDHRASIQQNRLFEDTSLLETLSPDERYAIEKAVDLMYPEVPLAKEMKLKSGTAFEFAKNLASGEVLKIFLHEVDTYDNLNTALRHVWNILDTRLQRTNKRELDYIEFIKTLDFNTKLKVSMLMDILYGRSTSEMVKARLAQEEEENKKPAEHYSYTSPVIPTSKWCLECNVSCSLEAEQCPIGHTSLILRTGVPGNFSHEYSIPKESTNDNT